MNVGYSFQLTHQASTLINTDSLVIQFPEEYSSIINSSFQSTICSTLNVSLPSNLSNINSGMVCSIKTNLLKISNFLLNNNSPALLIVQLTISNPSFNPNGYFSIWS